MQKKVYISILLITFAFTLLPGCGGGSGDGIIPAVSTPVSDNNDNAGYGSIHIKIVWPENGHEGKYIVSSSENSKNNITASMPENTKHVEIIVYNEDETTEFGRGTITWPAETDTTIDKIPLVKVVVKANAYSETGGVLLSTTKDDLQMVYSNENDLNLDLGEYKMEVTASPSSVNPGDETTLRAQLSFESTSGSAENSIAITGADVHFRIESGSGNFPNGKTIDKAVTGDDGKCEIILTTDPDSEENIKVYVALLFDSNIEHILASEYCDITIGRRLLWKEDFKAHRVCLCKLV